MKQEVKNAIVTVISVLLIIIVVYFATAIFLTKEIGSNNSSENNSVQSGLSLSYENIIIAGKAFSQKEEKYMVIFFSEKDSSDSLKNYLSTYDNSQKELKLYKVNLDEAINSFVKSEENNSNATKSSELKINKNTLMTINNGAIVSYVDEESQIIEVLK